MATHRARGKLCVRACVQACGVCVCCRIERRLSLHIYILLPTVFLSISLISTTYLIVNMLKIKTFSAGGYWNYWKGFKMASNLWIEITKVSLRFYPNGCTGRRFEKHSSLAGQISLFLLDTVTNVLNLSSEVPLFTSLRERFVYSESTFLNVPWLFWWYSLDLVLYFQKHGVF